jgi:hypothetical protein
VPATVPRLAEGGPVSLPSRALFGLLPALSLARHTAEVNLTRSQQ